MLSFFFCLPLPFSRLAAKSIFIKRLTFFPGNGGGVDAVTFAAVLQHVFYGAPLSCLLHAKGKRVASPT